MKSLTTILLTISSIAFTGESSIDPQTGALIQQLSSNEFAAREAAELAICKLGEPVLPALRVARQASTDPETQKRLDALIRLYPFERKSFTSADFTNTEKRIATLHSLYDEWVNERDRLTEVFKAGNHMFSGPFPTNFSRIAVDLRRLLKRKPTEIFAELNRMEADFEKSDAAKKEPDVFPDRSTPMVFLSSSLNELSPPRLAREELLKMSPESLRLMEREAAPSADEWQKFRTALNKVLQHGQGGMIGLASGDMTAAQVFTQIGMQANVRIFFDPPELAKETWEKKVVGKWFDLPFEKVLDDVSQKLELSWRFEGGPENRYVVIFQDRGNGKK